MAVDPRQVLAAFLTLSMFAMLGNMIKRDHFDNVLEVRIPDAASMVQLGVMKMKDREASAVMNTNTSLVGAAGPWGVEERRNLRSCWAKPDSKKGVENSKGYITFSLTSGPEYHLSQVTDAVVIARYLGATLVLPDIRGNELGQTRNFEDMYDIEKFMQSLDGVIDIVKDLPRELAAEKPALVRVPNRVTEEFIVNNIRPIFRSKSYLRLAIFFPSINMKVKEKSEGDLDSTACLTMFGSLELKPDIREVADQMIERLHTLSRKSDGHFVAVDLRVDVLEKKSCRQIASNGRKSCYKAHEIGEFLYKIGFQRDTVIYLTQTWWDDSLNPLRDYYPKTYTKDDIMPSDKKGHFLRSGSSELQKALDFHICSHSDVFVPAISGLFYGNVAGKRIASGKTQILVPNLVPGSSTSASDYISTYVTKKKHMAYSCYC